MLMRRRGLTTRDVGNAIDLDHSAVARWLKGTRPYAASVAKLAEYFGVVVDDLLDESRELPPDPTEERFSAAKAAAAKMPVDQPLAGQAVFEKTLERSLYIAQIRRVAERLRQLADEIDPPQTKEDINRQVYESLDQEPRSIRRGRADRKKTG